MKGFILLFEHEFGQSIWNGAQWTNIKNGDVPRVYASEHYARMGKEHAKPTPQSPTSDRPYFVSIVPVTIIIDTNEVPPLWKVRLSAWWSAIRSVFARLSA